MAGAPSCSKSFAVAALSCRGEDRSFAQSAVGRKLAAQNSRQVARDGQPQAGAAGFAHRVDAISLHQRFKHAAQIGFGNAHARVCDGNLHMLFFSFCGDADGARFGIFNGVSDQIVQDLLEPNRVCHHQGGVIGDINLKGHGFAA